MNGKTNRKIGTKTRKLFIVSLDPRLVSATSAYLTAGILPLAFVQKIIYFEVVILCF